ncbi:MULTISPECIES: DUF1002 domain-containing protein [Clostridium]|uniref:Uncharacterized protein YpuA, DUF1002 family n=1 Tax=Clostridium cadaveris TaxID=1529 RepID=A0A1I2P826_9CLOT|nr:DUF1002 domain-containing protein [Clostridium cadaveris]MDU4953051.1 DUF1002 domain-containing protein [Clostridium sp.]MDM8312956.1 DUF1002 domain-containing protein [Clostridium cadaveris]NME65771.1 DUF1002 domain-containing protein [Clostridium cadaveris]NWK11131.1 DUF1002 domain-containing protein [Clostridium cadaveris]SFG11229.1 Uncharacterized protein YpuA, DUF1002 family [Clostridium cadaveris]
MKFKKTFSKALALIMCLSLGIAVPMKTAKADSLKVVTLGADLTESQKESMLKYFGVTKKEANIVYVTNDEEFKYLGKAATKEQIGSKAISCSYIEPTNKGGLKISINNIHWVTENMIKNSLITAGIENANVVVGAPFNVSGTAALTGILKGFENSSAGEKIDENKKEAANEELVVTGNLGEKIGQDEAAGLINEIKKEVVKENPKSEKDVKNIVEKTTSSYKDIKDKLSDEDIEKITALMDKINDLDLDFSKIKDQLNDVSSLLKEKLGSEEAQSFFSKIGEFLRNIGNFFSNLFS